MTMPIIANKPRFMLTIPLSLLSFVFCLLSFVFCLLRNFDNQQRNNHQQKYREQETQPKDHIYPILVKPVDIPLTTIIRIPNDRLIATLNVFRISFTSSSLLIVKAHIVFFFLSKFLSANENPLRILINSKPARQKPALFRCKKPHRVAQGYCKSVCVGVHKLTPTYGLIWPTLADAKKQN